LEEWTRVVKPVGVTTGGTGLPPRRQLVVYHKRNRMTNYLMQRMGPHAKNIFVVRIYKLW